MLLVVSWWGMPRIISDDEINKYILEKKLFDSSIFKNFNPPVVKGHKRKVIEIDGESGTRFKLFYRENIRNPLDFSVGLCVIREDTGDEFCLKRYNGKSHWHRNKCPKGNGFWDFHIHKATKKCQEDSIQEEDFAEISKKYSTARQALDLLLFDCGFSQTIQSTLSLVGEY